MLILSFKLGKECRKQVTASMCLMAKKKKKWNLGFLTGTSFRILTGNVTHPFWEIEVPQGC